jgi:hypothetical protein
LVKSVAAVADIIVLIIIFPIVMFYLRKYHRSEYKIHRCAFFAYTLGMIFYLASMFQIDMYWYYQVADPHEDGKRMKITHSNICWNLLGVHHLLIPLLILIFKKEKDIFSCFTKLDDMATISIF